MFLSWLWRQRRGGELKIEFGINQHLFKLKSKMKTNHSFNIVISGRFILTEHADVSFNKLYTDEQFSSKR